MQMRVHVVMRGARMCIYGCCGDKGFWDGCIGTCSIDGETISMNKDKA